MLHYLFSLTLVAVLALVSVAQNVPTLVNLRIEGLKITIFEGTIVTQGHNVTTPSGGTHHCDGTNNNANPLPGPTCTSALDDASKANHFTFDGYVSYFLNSHCGGWLIHGVYSTFTVVDDFSITSIAGDTQTSTEFWGILLGFEYVSGCQQEVQVNGEILYAFNAFNALYFLKLVGQPTATVGWTTLLFVTDGQTGKPVAGATVNGLTSSANGEISIVFTQVGTQYLKATKSDAIRSNQISIKVCSEGGPC